LKKLEQSFVEGLTCGENMPFRMASPYSCFGNKDREIIGETRKIIFTKDQG
jgi:hypothetical protein